MIRRKGHRRRALAHASFVSPAERRAQQDALDAYRRELLRRGA